MCDHRNPSIMTMTPVEIVTHQGPIMERRYRNLMSWTAMKSHCSWEVSPSLSSSKPDLKVEYSVIYLKL